ncbi:MAG: type III pantothenate kinase [Muribaculaceae bacterium]|nr:type III pantothenate kinase [Muribaculaceae bacterium]MDE6843676.1 type III pantothenate kinase [Muribaculaceae bacterium]
MGDSRRILTLDRGNTRLKASLFEGRTLVSTIVIDSDDFSTLTSAVDFGSLHGAMWCSVGPAVDPILDRLRSLNGLRLVTLGPDTSLPFGVRYGSRATLGADRVAAAAGAVALWPGEQLIIADAGTALTIDIVCSGSQRPVFLGGNISPGVGMRLRSLHEYTARLPLVSPDGELPAWGVDTVTALRCGAVRGAVAEIMALRNLLETRTKTAVRIVLTGGDAPLLSTVITDCPLCSLEPELVAYGLLSIYEHTENDE